MAPKGGKGKKPSGGGDDKGGDKNNGDLKVANSLKLRHILCEKQSKSLEALGKLAAGEKFDAVATAFSEDKARQGGSLGWMVRAAMNGEFQAQCFSIPPSTCAAPIYKQIKTKHGYQLSPVILYGGRAPVIVMVEDRKL